MQRGLVLDAAGNPLAPDAAYVAGATIHYYRELEHEHEIPFEAQVLYRDAQLLIADKPHLLTVVASGRLGQQTQLHPLTGETGVDGMGPTPRMSRQTTERKEGRGEG